MRTPLDIIQQADWLDSLLPRELKNTVALRMTLKEKVYLERHVNSMTSEPNISGIQKLEGFTIVVLPEDK